VAAMASSSKATNKNGQNQNTSTNNKKSNNFDIDECDEIFKDLKIKHDKNEKLAKSDPKTTQNVTIIGNEKACQIKTSEWEYNGDIKNNRPHGFGIKNWTNGQRYSGEWIEGHPHGSGVMSYKDGRRITFSGEWNKGQQVYGTLNCISGERYTGECQDHKRHGHGISQYSDGDRYVGAYKNNLREGKGIYYFLVAVFMLGTGRKVKEMATVITLMLRVMSIKEIMKMIRDTAKENVFFLMGEFLKGNGRLTFF